MFCVNFDNIGRELRSAEEAEARYWRENDAKFRAIEQKVATYDEFRDIVSASHLKPIRKNNRKNESGISPKVLTSQKNTSRSRNYPFSDKEQILMGQPDNLEGFLSMWHKIKDDASLAYNFLVGYEPAAIKNVFVKGMDPNLLGEILHSLEKNFTSEDGHSISQLLFNISSLNRFRLSKEMLNAKEKLATQSLLKKIESKLSPKDLALLKGTFM